MWPQCWRVLDRRNGFPGKGAYERPCVGIPQPEGLIPTPTCDSLIHPGLNDHAMDIIRMAGEGVYERSRVGIPQSDGLIMTPTCDFASIGAECDDCDRIRMPGEGAYERPRSGLP